MSGQRIHEGSLSKQCCGYSILLSHPYAYSQAQAAVMV